MDIFHSWCCTMMLGHFHCLSNCITYHVGFASHLWLNITTESRKASVDVFLKAAGYLDCAIRNVLPQILPELRFTYLEVLLITKFISNNSLLISFSSLASFSLGSVSLGFNSLSVMITLIILNLIIFQCHTGKTFHWT